MSDDEEFETVIYNGPGQPYIIINESEELPFYANVQQNVKPLPMEVRLAHAAAQHDGLLSPKFFITTPDSASSGSSRESVSSSEIISYPSPPRISSAMTAQNLNVSPFAFPKFTPKQTKKSNTMTENIVKLERVEILDEYPDETNESEWIEWPKTYIEQKGFRLGIHPGDFYRNQSRPCFYVKLPHRCSYEILVTNSNQVACNLDLYVNGQYTNAIRLPAGATRSVDGPIYSKYAFKMFRTKDAPKDKKVKEGARENGVVEAVFTPEKVGGSSLRAVSEPKHGSKLVLNDLWDILEDSEEKQKLRSYTTNDGNAVERSLDMSQVVEGVTLLQGEKKKKTYSPAPDMETDLSKRVVLQLRLVASLVEEVAASEQEVYNLEPPPLPSRRY